jgi:hypothetical protein
VHNFASHKLKLQSASIGNDKDGERKSQESRIVIS